MGKKKLTEEERAKKKARELSRQSGVLGKANKVGSAKANQSSLLKYLAERFGIQYFTSPFCLKLVSINEGTYRGLVSGIGYNQLLDMFKYYDKEIEQGVAYLKVKNPTVTREATLNYALGIVLGKLNDYQEVLDNTDDTSYGYELTDIYDIKNQLADKARMESKKKTIDISSFLDDDF